MNEALTTVLCVDDDANLLHGMERTLNEHYEVTTAVGGVRALETLQQSGPVDIVISDMRMPGMDGARFLTEVRRRWPDTVRILLTGYSDTTSAIAAINDGAIFRYLCKPCPAESLLATLRQAVSHAEVLKAERALIESTLAATVKTLADILAIASPWGSRRSTFARSCVQHALAKLRWPEAWLYEMAAALSQIGTIGMPEETLRRDATRHLLNRADAKLLIEHPETAYSLLSEIPRLEKVAQIVRYQAKPPPDDACEEVVRGSQLLRASLLISQHLQRGSTLGAALEELRPIAIDIAPAIVAALADFRLDSSAAQTIEIDSLVPGLVLTDNVITTKGQLLLSKGHALTEAAIHTLRRLKAASLVNGPLCVRGGRGA